MRIIVEKEFWPERYRATIEGASPEDFGPWQLVGSGRSIAEAVGELITLCPLAFGLKIVRPDKPSYEEC